MNRTDRILDTIKNNKLVAVALVAAAFVVGVLTFFDRIFSFYDTHLASGLELVSMHSAPESARVFSDYQGLSCRFDQKTIRSFEPRDEHVPSGRLDLVFTFTNTSGVPVAFRAAIVEVAFVERLAGGGPGVVESNHTYLLEIDFATGDQRFPLAPAYNIPAGDTGAFTLALTPRRSGIGLCWIARMVFDTTAGRVASEPFQMVLSKE